MGKLEGARRKGSISLGVDRFLERPRAFLGPASLPKRVGLLTHDGAWTGPVGPATELTRVALLRSGLPLAHLFSPEHGITASAPDGEAVPHGTDIQTGLPVSSLYGSQLRPTSNTLENLDLVLVDLQDVGVRFYTYLWTLSHLLEACAEAGVPVLILDRPNPLGGKPVWVEGPMPDSGFPSHFLARWHIPVRHSLTLGEMARLLVAEMKLDVSLGVVRVDGWERGQLLTETGLAFHPPSPGLPSSESVLLYPGLALLEATNVLEGRGTDRAFQWFGAPWMEGEKMTDELNRAGAPGIRAHPRALVVPQQAAPCPGVLLEISDARELRPVALGLQLLSLLFTLWPEKAAWTPYPTAVHGRGKGHLHRLLVSKEIVGALEHCPHDVNQAAIAYWTEAPKWWGRVEEYLLYE